MKKLAVQAVSSEPVSPEFNQDLAGTLYELTRLKDDQWELAEDAR